MLLLDHPLACLLQKKQVQLPQSLLVGPVLKAPDQHSNTPLDPNQFLNTPLKLDTSIPDATLLAQGRGG